MRSWARNAAWSVGGLTAVVWLFCLGVLLGFLPSQPRPNGVPIQATYSGGFDMAPSWIDCSFDPAKDVDVCRAWNEKAELIAFGSYRLDGEAHAARPADLYPSHVLKERHPNLSWIRLRNGKTLVPVNTAGQPLERFEVTIGDGNQ